MAILKIARMGHPVLRRIAEPVADLVAGPMAEKTALEIAALKADMIATLADIGGLGLAAPQVYVSLRMIIFHIPPARAAAERYRSTGFDGAGEEVPMTVLINPRFEPLGEAVNRARESCLSVPGMSGEVSRYSEIVYRGLAPDGSLVERRASGFHARLVQHECDHLDGVLYPQRMDDLSTFGYSEEILKSVSESE